MKREIISALLMSGLLSYSTVAAQNVRKDSATINKELFLQQEFIPVVKDAAKINQVPQIEQEEIKRQAIDYVSQGLSPVLRPYPFVLDQTLFLTHSQHANQLGFVRFGIGAHLNAEMAAGISMINNDQQTLLLSYDGSLFNGKRKIVQIDTTRKFRDAYHNLSLDWDAKMGKLGMKATLFYRNGSFNYIRYGAFDENKVEAIESNTYLEKVQYTNQLGFNFALSPLNSKKQSWRGFAEYSVFNKSITEFVTEKGVTEHRIRLKGNKYYELDDKWSIGGDLQMQSYLYAKEVTLIDSFSNLDSRTRFTIAPNAQYSKGRFNAKLGFRLDPVFSTNNKAFLSPDVLLDYRFNDDNYLEASLTGDVIDYDFEYTNRLYRYLSPNIRLSEVHRPYIASLSYRATFLQLLNIRLSATSFKERESHFLGVSNETGTSSLIDLFRKDILGNKLEADFFYNFSNKGTVRLMVNKTFWSLGDEALERPGFQIMIDGTYRPSERLSLSLSYNLMGDRHGYNWVNDRIEYIRPIHNLAFSASYRLNKAFNLFVKGDNLLFQQYDTFLGVPSQGATLMLGAAYKF